MCNYAYSVCSVSSLQHSLVCDFDFRPLTQMLVKNGAIIAISNKYGDTPLAKARPRLRKKLEALAVEYGQSLVIVPHKSELNSGGEGLN